MRSIAEAAITLPAQSMPLYAMLLLPQAIVCHVCRGMPLGHVAVSICAAGVAVSVLNDGVFFARSGFLRKAGERVKFAEDTDIRSAAAKRAAERGVYAAELFAHIEAVLAQDAAVKRRGLILL